MIRHTRQHSLGLSFITPTHPLYLAIINTTIWSVARLVLNTVFTSKPECRSWNGITMNEVCAVKTTPPKIQPPKLIEIKTIHVTFQTDAHFQSLELTGFSSPIQSFSNRTCNLSQILLSFSRSRAHSGCSHVVHGINMYIHCLYDLFTGCMTY